MQYTQNVHKVININFNARVCFGFTIFSKAFQALKLNRQHRYIIFKIDNENIHVDSVGERSLSHPTISYYTYLKLIQN